MNPLWLLATCSLQFAAPDWSYEASGIHLGLRQSAFIQQHTADGWQVQSAAVSSPWATDLLYTFPRPITRNEKPFITLWIYIPTLPTTPNANGRYQYLGMRVTEIVEPNQMVWCGCFISRDDLGPTVTFRPLAGSPTGDIPTGFYFNENEWLTLGLSWNDDGALCAYAREGMVALSGDDLVATDDGTIWNGSAWETSPLYIKHLTEVRGLFLDIAYAPAEAEQPVFLLAKIETRAAIAPTLTLSDGLTISLTGFPSESYRLQRSADLVAWDDAATMTSGDSFSEPIMGEKQFYRAAQP